MKQLEFLTQYEVEMTATGTAATEYFIETVSPVDTHHTNHRKEDTLVLVSSINGYLNSMPKRVYA